MVIIKGSKMFLQEDYKKTRASINKRIIWKSVGGGKDLA